MSTKVAPDRTLAVLFEDLSEIYRYGGSVYGGVAEKLREVADSLDASKSSDPMEHGVESVRDD